MSQVAGLASFCPWVLDISFKDVQLQDSKMFRKCNFVYESIYLYATIENKKITSYYKTYTVKSRYNTT